MTSISCSACGVGLKLPPDCAAAAIRCPKCKNVIPLGGVTSPTPPKDAAEAPVPEVIPITCPSCSKQLRASVGLAGKAIRCPGCRNRVDVPGPTAPEDKHPVKKEGGRVGREEPVPAASDGDEGRPEKRRPRKTEAEEESAESSRPRVRSGGDPFEGLEVPEDMQEGIHKELEEGEEIVWVGRPMTEIVLAKGRVAFFVGILLAVVGVGGMTIGVVVGHQVALVMGLCVGGFLTLLSIPCMLSPILLRRFNHKRPCYIVTRRRAIVYYGGMLGVRSYDRRQLMVHLDRQESSWAERAGSLIFEVVVSFESTGTGHGRGRAGVREEKTEYGFLDVADVANVEQLIRDTIIERKPDPAEERLRDDAKTPAAKKQQAAPAENGVVRATDRPNTRTDRKRRDSDEDESRPIGDSEQVVLESDVHETLKAKILDRLTDGEDAVWVGRPLPRLILIRSLPSAIMTVVISVVICIFILKSNAFHDWWVFLGIGVLFVIGLLMPFYRLLRARFTAYVLTNRRCLVFEPTNTGTVKATAYLPDIVSRMRRNAAWTHKGAGDLIFRTVTVITTTTSRNRRSGATSSSSSVSETHYGFLAVEDLARVEKLLNRHLIQPYLDRVHGV